MIDINKLFIRLLEDLEESSPNLRKSLKEISPLEFCINIKGHKNIYIKIDDKDSEISFGKNNPQFEIRGSLIELLNSLVSKKLNKNLIFGNSELAIVFVNIILKSNIDVIYLIDKLFFDKIHKYLKKGSTINIATDSKSYISQILETIHYIKQDFKWINQSKSDWDYNPEILPETKYYKKALKNGLKPFFAKLEKL